MELACQMATAEKKDTKFKERGILMAEILKLKNEQL
jgi:hypothetical protein